MQSKEQESAHMGRPALQLANAQPKDTREIARKTICAYTHVAYALARDYTDLFYVNMETGDFVEFRSDDERGMLLETRRASGFFESCKREAKLYVHPDDQDAFVDAMNQEFLSGALSDHGEYEMTYRRIMDDRAFYVQTRISRMKDDERYIVVAVSDIDELESKRREEERIQEELLVYARLHAIAGNSIVVYVVNPKTEHYRVINATDAYVRQLGLQQEGEDFFEQSRELTRRIIHPLDLARFLAAFTKTNVMAAINRDGMYTLGYRLVMNGRPLFVQLKAAMVEESNGPRLIVGFYDIDMQVRQEEETEKRLAQAQAQANVDALTGVKNRHAYLEAQERLDAQIAMHQPQSFAIVVLDVNDLKKVNDTEGHQMGDQYLRDACHVICDTFKHSPVFRMGGDEFAVIAQGMDYAHIDERLWDLSVHNEEAQHNGDVVIACGVALYEDGDSVADMFDRADRNMYEDKTALKAKWATLD